MKKLFLLFITIILAFALVSCSSEPAPEQTTETTPEPTTEPAPEQDESGYMTGLGTVISSTVAEASSEAGPSAQIDNYMVVASFDQDGKIMSVSIDVAQQKAMFDVDGMATNEVDLRTKVEKGDDYNMAGASPIGKEYYEQMAGLEQYMIGKTVDEVMALEKDEAGYPTDPDVITTTTINVSSHLKALEKAYANAKATTGMPATTGLGTVTTAKIGEADGEVGASAQIDTYMIAASFDADGKIVAVTADTAQQRNSFNVDGTIASEANTMTKVEQGDDYGMAAASPIGKEYYEQMAGLEQYMIGKTVEEVKMMALDQSGYPTDTDVTATTTINLTNFLEALEKAYSNAK